jgi:hypothetical protein
MAAYSVRGALCGRLVYHIIWLSMIYKTYNIVLGHSEYRLQSCTSKAPTCRLRLFSRQDFTPDTFYSIFFIVYDTNQSEQMNENGMSREKAEG